jgi:hypothetical protein
MKVKDVIEPRKSILFNEPEKKVHPVQIRKIVKKYQRTGETPMWLKKQAE